VNKNGIFPNCYSFLAITNSKMKIFLTSVFLKRCLSKSFTLTEFSKNFWRSSFYYDKIIEIERILNCHKFASFWIFKQLDIITWSKYQTQTYVRIIILWKKPCTLLNTFFCTCRLKSNSLKEFWCKKNVLQWIIILYWRLYYDQALWNFLFHIFNLT
jgi:hypothetical protein